MTNITWRVGGRKVNSPIAKLCVLAILLVWIPLTLPLHFAVWLFNGRGFLKRPGLNYEPPTWASLLSLALGTLGTLALLGVL